MAISQKEKYMLNKILTIRVDDTLFKLVGKLKANHFNISSIARTALFIKFTQCLEKIEGEKNETTR